MRHIPVCIFFFAILFTACADKQVLVNKKRNCKLQLYSDSTYAFKYPTFMGKAREKGTYQLKGNSILLTRTVENRYGSVVDLSSGYYLHPDTLAFSFRNLNDSTIAVTFTLNENPTVFTTNKDGRLKIPYSELVSKNIAVGESLVHSITITYNNKRYNVANASLLPNPTSIEIKLNQFVGEKTAVLYRKFKVDHDTVIVNGIDPKAIGAGNNRKLIKK